MMTAPYGPTPISLFSLTPAAAAARLREHLLALERPSRGPAGDTPDLSVPKGLIDIRSRTPQIVVLPAPAWSEPELRFLVRPEVADRLAHTAATLPENLRLGFWEGLRPVSVQKTLWDRGLAFLHQSHPDSTGTELEWMLEQYVARPTGKMPPHSTGSAVDIAPVDAYGRVLTPDDAWGRLAMEQLSVRLRDTGLAHYDPEWWHWSYGDDEWARVYDCVPLAFATEAQPDSPGDGI